MNKSEYAEYLASREWAVLKVAVKKRAKGLCERCTMAPIDATHHLTYERIGHENLDDLQGVCADCHSFLSGLSDIDPLEHSRKLLFDELPPLVEKAVPLLAEILGIVVHFPLLESTAYQMLETYRRLTKMQAEIHYTGSPHVPDDRHEAVG